MTTRWRGIQTIHCSGAGLATTGCECDFGSGITAEENSTGVRASVRRLRNGGFVGAIRVTLNRVSHVVIAGTGAIAVTGSSAKAGEVILAVIIPFAGLRERRPVHVVECLGTTQTATRG